ncbi:MAG TPA: response regulator transcription factor [Phenylobacterium sp.]|jgi:DNA-binding NarL/FixJ family response regulator
MLRILIADNQPVVRLGVRDLIECHPGWEVCGAAADGQQALDLAMQVRPDVAVVEVTLPTVDGIALTRRLCKACPTVRVLLFTCRDDEETITAGLAAGACGYVLKSDSGRSLEQGIAALGDNRRYLSPPVANFLAEAALHDPSPSG